MTRIAMSRRGLFEIGAAAGTALVVEAAQAQMSDASANEAVVRKFFRSWEKKDWAPFDAILADNFTFTSPNGDDHLSKTVYKKRCWDSQIGFVRNFDIEFIASSGDAVAVKYLCHTANGKSFRNMEYHRLRGHRIEAIECYFGQMSSFASAVGSNK